MNTATTTCDRRPLLIVVSSLGASSRETFFQSVAPQYRIWLFLGGPGRTSQPSWELPYIVGHTVVNTQDSAAMLGAARELAQRLPIDGVVCFDEARIEATAELATALGLPTSGIEAITRCRDKWQTRQALAAAGVGQAESVPVRSLDEARRAAGRIGYPVVLKPRAMAASFGVIRVDSDEQLAASYRHARDVTLPEANVSFEDGVLVEEYLDGPEISVDCACFEGRVVPVTLARKQTGFAPAFEETGHVVDASDPLLVDAELRDILTRAHRAVGFHTGTTHVELRLTRRGIKLVEINARLGGDLIPYLGQLASGTDLSLAAAAIACGRTPDLSRPLDRVAAIRFYYPEQDVTVAAVSFDEALLPFEIERAVPLADPGQHVVLPPRGSAWECRLAQVVAVADSTAACDAALAAAGKALVVEPVEGTEGSPT
jgi:biotin carboxylase